MNTVVQQPENNYRQGKFILLLTHILTGLAHTLGVNIFLADKFSRIAPFFAFNGKAVTVDHGHQHIGFINRNIGRLEIYDIMPAFVQRGDH